MCALLDWDDRPAVSHKLIAFQSQVVYDSTVEVKNCSGNMLASPVTPARVQALTPSACQIVGNSGYERLQSTVKSEGCRNQGNIPVVLYLVVSVMLLYFWMFCCVESPH